MKVYELAFGGWIDRSKTFGKLFEAAIDVGVEIFDADDVDFDDPNQPGGIYLSGANAWQKEMTASDVVILSHELRHATGESFEDLVDFERDAFKYQGVVANELIAAGYEVSEDAMPLDDEEIEEVYREYYYNEDGTERTADEMLESLAAVGEPDSSGDEEDRNQELGD